LVGVDDYAKTKEIVPFMGKHHYLDGLITTTLRSYWSSYDG